MKGRWGKVKYEYDDPRARPFPAWKRTKDSLVRKRTARWPRSKWQLTTEADSVENTLCGVCKALREQCDADLLSRETIFTSSSRLATGAVEGCLVCQILKLSIQAYATNLRAQGSKDENRIRLQDFSLDHKIELWARRGETLHMRVKVIVMSDFSSDFSGWHENRETIENHDLEIYTIEAGNELLWIFGLGRHVSEKLVMRACLHFLRGLLNDCDSHHKLCKQIEQPTLPRRIIQIGDGKVRLVDNGTSQLRGQYTTLSYCWGPAEALIKTTMSNLADMEVEIPSSKLPILFMEAIILTTILGIRYIWIDCLCIVQDDTSEWETEAPKMSDYYSCSYLTIAGTRCGSPTERIFSKRPLKTSESAVHPKLFTSSAMNIELQGAISLNLFVRPEFHDARSAFATGGRGMPLMERGWVFQERLLARRTIHFHASELVFECQESFTCECDAHQGQNEDTEGPSMMHGLRTSMPHPQSPPTEETLTLAMDYWLDIIQAYTRKKLTRETDRLPALSGLASRLAKQFKITYLAGIWLEDLPRQLLWQISGFTNVESMFTRRLNQRRAPDWSWASVHSDSFHPNYAWVQRPGFTVNREVRVIQAFTETAEKNAFGGVDSGCVQLIAKAIKVEVGTDLIKDPDLLIETDSGMDPGDQHIPRIQVKPYLVFEGKKEGQRKSGYDQITIVTGSSLGSTEDSVIGQADEGGDSGIVRMVEEKIEPADLSSKSAQQKGKGREQRTEIEDDEWSTTDSQDEVLGASQLQEHRDTMEVPASGLDLDLHMSMREDEFYYDGESLKDKNIYCILLGHGRPSPRQSRFDMDIALVVSSSEPLEKQPSCKRMGVFKISSWKCWFEEAECFDILLV